jgi:putative transcriptional regulator
MKKEMFNELAQSIHEAGKIRKGLKKPSRVFKYKPVDIKKIRSKVHASQVEMAHMIGVSVKTLQNWEQGRRKPRGPARALLKVFDTNPKDVLKALK